jgi:hypothetical protein
VSALFCGITEQNKLGGLVMVPESAVKAFDEYRKPVTPFIYNPEIDVCENIVNARKLSGLGGYVAFLDKLIRSPKHQTANVMLKSTGAVENIRFQEFWGPVGWAGKDIPRGEEVGALLRPIMKVTNF